MYAYFEYVSVVDTRALWIIIWRARIHFTDLIKEIASPGLFTLGAAENTDDLLFR